MAFTHKQYSGSPDIFTQEGQRITEQQAQSAGLFTPQGLSPQVEKIATPRPDIQSEADFATKAGTNIPTIAVNLGKIQPNLTSDTLKGDIGTKIKNLLEENKKAREDYVASLKPTQAITDIKTQLANLREQASQKQLAYEQSALNIEQERKAMPLITGEQQALFKQADIETRKMIAQEANLLARLGMEQEAQQAITKSLETGMNFIAQDLELQLKIKDRIQKEEDSVLQRAAELRDDSRQVLSTILSQFKGMDIAKLTPEIQQQLAITATQAGIPLDVLIAGMTAVKNQQEFENNLALSKVKPTSTIPAPIITSNGKIVEYGTPEYVIERLKQTSGSKTKPVASEREQLGKFANVVSLTDNLMNSLNKTTNDPIIGYLRSLNPYNFDARAVNAQIIALVPSVARALYGEVGVLTDTDIERYLKTLPNIKSTKEQNRFIAGMTLSNARRAYEQTLLNLANSNVNVAGFVDSYKNLIEKLTELEGELNTVPEIPIGTTATLDAILSGKIQTPKKSFFSLNPIELLWNKLFGK